MSVWMAVLIVGWLLKPILFIIQLMLPMAGLIVCLTTGLKAELDLKDRSAPNQGIKNSCKNMLILTTIFVIVIVPYTLLVLVPVFSKRNGLEHIPWFLLIASICLFLLIGGGWALVSLIFRQRFETVMLSMVAL
jgi:hypothetical protein